MSSDASPRNPFLDPDDVRTDGRRLRGRLAAPVTIVTAGGAEDPVGLTVSSVIVAEGEPDLTYFLIGSATDLYYSLVETGRFVLHVCAARDREAADVFAGLRPSPGGAFAGREWTMSDWGPVLSDIGTRAYGRVQAMAEESYSVIVTAAIEAVDLVSESDPLVHFRGAYRRLL